MAFITTTTTAVVVIKTTKQVKKARKLADNQEVTKKASHTTREFTA